MIPDMDSAAKALTIITRLFKIMRVAGYALALYAIVQGSLIIVGGPNRFPPVSYNMAMLVPGAPETWGWVICFAGILAFAGIRNRRYQLTAVGMGLAAIWSFMFGGAFLLSSILYDDGNLTSIAVHGKDAFLFTIASAATELLSHHKTIRGSDDDRTEGTEHEPEL